MRFLFDAPRWLLIAALFFAPWFYGGTTEQGITVTSSLVGAAVLLWLCGLPFRSARSDVKLSRALLISVLALVVLGWWMVLNARTIYDSDFVAFVSTRSLAGGLSGSVDQAVSAAWMLRATALLGAVCVAADAARDALWLSRFCLTIATVGGSISFLGLVQKATRAPMIFWRGVDQPVGTFFATFYYHGNAGAFLNLTLPVTAGLAYRSFVRHERPFARAAWSTACFLNVVAVFANTSRMGHFVGLLTLLALGVILVRQQQGRLNWGVALAGGAAVLVAAYAFAQSTSISGALERWNTTGGTISADARWISSRAALHALPDAGWLGFGAGTFHIVFPYYTAAFGERLAGFWHHLHEDYLQTLLEWGLIGSALWAFVFFGGAVAASRARLSARAKDWLPRQRLLLPLIILALVGLGLHALVDFPLQIVSIQLYVATYLGICWSAPQWRAGVA